MYRAYGKCGFCGEWMTELEAEESQWGNEDRDELMCDGCFKLAFGETADPPETKLETSTLAPISELIANANELYQ